jgi:hypothetical protein
VLAELADDALDEPARAVVERHLDDCAACTELIATFAWIIAPPPPSPPGYELRAPLGPRSWQVGTGIAVTYGVRCVPDLVAVRHPNLAAVLAVGEVDGEPYVVHEYFATTEREWRDAEPRSADAIVLVWRGVLAGLAALHRAGVAHGQISPERVFVEGDRIVLGAPVHELAATSGYLAPERLEGAASSRLADQFGVCAAAWEALAGRTAYSGATIGALLVTTATPPELPEHADHRLAILARGLAASPGNRYRDVDALATALARPPRRFGAIALVLALIAAVGTALAIATR